MSKLWRLFINLPYLSYCLPFEQPNRTYECHLFIWFIAQHLFRQRQWRLILVIVREEGRREASFGAMLHPHSSVANFMALGSSYSFEAGSFFSSCVQLSPDTPPRLGQVIPIPCSRRLSTYGSSNQTLLVDYPFIWPAGLRAPEGQRCCRIHLGFLTLNGGWGLDV